MRGPHLQGGIVAVIMPQLLIGLGLQHCGAVIIVPVPVVIRICACKQSTQQQCGAQPPIDPATALLRKAAAAHN